jgi:hypothetical protein
MPTAEARDKTETAAGGFGRSSTKPQQSLRSVTAPGRPSKTNIRSRRPFAAVRARPADAAAGRSATDQYFRIL